jgi:hypothetical protein
MFAAASSAQKRRWRTTNWYSPGLVHLQQTLTLQTLYAAQASERFLPFHEARSLARDLRLTSRAQWTRWWRESRPANLPANGAAVYAHEEGWVSWSDFLGYGERTRSHRGALGPLVETLEAARIRSSTTGSFPAAHSHRLTVSLAASTGAGIAPRNRQISAFLPFEEAREQVR